MVAGKIIRCPHGHFYSPDDHEDCPECVALGLLEEEVEAAEPTAQNIAGVEPEPEARATAVNTETSEAPSIPSWAGKAVLGLAVLMVLGWVVGQFGSGESNRVAAVEGHGKAGPKIGGARISRAAEFSVQLMQGLLAYDAKDYGQAMDRLKPLAKMGNARAIFNIGAMHENGNGMPASNEEAAKRFIRSGELGYVAGQSAAGFMYENGRGVMRDHDEAIRWYQLAAAQGNSRAQEALGRLKAESLGTDEDLNLAYRRYREQDYKAAYPVILSYAEAGNEWAAHYIGLMYFNGYGVEQDEEESIKWFRFGAEYGVANSQWFLSYFYRNGRGGIETNPVEAYVWLKLAIPRLPQGEHRDRAGADLGSLVNTLTSDQIGQADAYLGNVIPGLDESMMMGG